jgi:hypothetical protein
MLVLGFFLASTLPLSGCDDSPATSVRGARGTGAPSKSSKRRNKSTPGKAKAQCRSLPTNLVSASWVERKTLVAEAKASTLRDPFEVAAENLVEEDVEAETSTDPRLDSVVSGYEVSELKFTMAVTGQPPAFALLKDPSGFGHDVYVGDIVGTKPKMRVEAITNNEIVFQAVERVKGSNETREHRKSLLTPEELQELQP